MKTAKVYLIERSRVLKSGKEASYHVLLWPKAHGGGMQSESVGRTSKTGGSVTKAMAKEAKRKKEQDIGAGRIGIDKPSGITLSELERVHETTALAGKSPMSRYQYHIATKHLIRMLGDVPINQIDWTDAGELREFLAADKDREGKPKRAVGETTVYNTLANLKTMFARAVDWELLHKNPFGKIKLGSPPKPVRRVYTETELAAMMDVAITPWWKTLIQLAYTSGLRRGELMHLRWDEDFDADKGTVRVQARPESLYVTNGGDEVPILAWKPKSQYSVRTVPIPPATVSALLRHRLLAAGSPYVFITVSRLLTIGAIPRRRPLFQLYPDCEICTEFQQIQRNAKELLGVRNWGRGSMHDLRSTFGSIAAAAGVPMRELQQWMGHSDIRVTAAYYVHVQESAGDRLRAVFGEIRSAAG